VNVMRPPVATVYSESSVSVAAGCSWFFFFFFFFFFFSCPPPLLLSLSLSCYVAVQGHHEPNQMSSHIYFLLPDL